MIGAAKCRPYRDTPSSPLPKVLKIDMSMAMTRIMSKDGRYVTAFVLQDHKRLPARFFAMISGALNSRLR